MSEGIGGLSTNSSGDDVEEERKYPLGKHLGNYSF